MVFFGIGVIVAAFQKVGKTPLDKDVLNKCTKKGAKMEIQFFRRVVGKTSHEEDLLGSRRTEATTISYVIRRKQLNAKRGGAAGKSGIGAEAVASRASATLFSKC